MKITFGVVVLFVVGITGTVPAQEKVNPRPTDLVVVIDDANDLEAAHDQIYETALRKGFRSFLIKVKPMPKGDLGRLLAGKPEEPRVSRRQTVMEAYIQARDSVIAEIGKKDAALAKAMIADELNLRGNLAKVEEHLGLTKAHEGLGLVERCRRVAWVGALRNQEWLLIKEPIDVTVEFLPATAGK